MKLLSLDLTNFRQFYGQQHVEFAPGSAEGRNITVFHGFNGAGKTALLNSFVWCLYGELTPDLEHKDRLVNEKAFAEAGIGDEVPCGVALQFEFRNEIYRAERTADVSKTGAVDSNKSKVTFQLIRTTRGGETEPVGRDEGARQHRIEQMLPRSLYRFFFFNGERVEELAKADAYENIEAGVKTLLDIEVYERGANHLRGAVTKALAEEAKKAGDKQLADAMDLLEARHAEQNRLREEITEHEANVRALLDEIAQAERRQEQLRDVAQLANRRKQLREEESELKAKLKSENKALSALVSKNGYLAFGLKALDITEAQVAAARRRGDLPAKIKPQFVDDLLDSRLCVCRRPIHPGSPEERALEEYRGTTGLADLEERIAGVSADVRSLRDRRQATFQSCDEALGRITGLRGKLRICQEDLSAINDRIAEGDYGEEAARVQEVIRQRNDDIMRQRVSIVRNTEKIQEIEDSIADLRERTKNLETQSDKAARAKRQLDAVQRVADALAAIRDIQKEDVRIALDKQVREIWLDAAIKDYEASVSSKYQLLLTKNVGGQRQPVMGASTGEKQVLALSFVGAMVRKARENVGRQQHGVDGGGFFPLVMDSPFGSLEDEYRSKVAIWLPSLANQVIVMASKSQWRNEVESAMRPRIGREYVLELHTSKRDADRQISLDGKEVAYVVSGDDDVEMTIIRRVR
jgi:DNA sulfur modification protein DndD